jgi:hypothetical protein
MPTPSLTRSPVFVLAGLIVLALTGCATATTVAAPAPTTYYGQTATAVATLITGCTDIKVGDIGKGAQSGLTSTATCMLNGRLVNINAWASADAQGGVAGVLRADTTEAYFAEGTGWTLTTADNVMLQLQLTNDAGALMQYSADNPTPPPADLPGEKSTAEAAAKALGGKVTHLP